MSKIIYSTDEELQQLHAEAIHILNNLRFHTKYWHKHYGQPAKINREYWEQKADELLNGLGLEEHNRLDKILVMKT